MKKVFKKTDNHGATMVFTLLAIVVVLILASLILSVSLANVRSKGIDNMARENFYSVEQAANEMYAGVGSYAMGILGEAYATTLSSISMGNLTGTVIQVPSDELNIYFKEEYMLGVIEHMTGATYVKNTFFAKDASGAYTGTTVDYSDDATKARIKGILENCLSVSSGVTVDIKGNVCFDYAKFKFIVGDVHVAYENADMGSTNPLESKETFDMEIGFPDWSLSFMDAARPLERPYVNYVMLSDERLDFNQGGTVNGGLYAKGTAKSYNNPVGLSTMIDSNGGIRVNNVALTVNPKTGAVVTSGDIVVKSSVAESATFSLEGTTAKLWCSNFLVDSNNSVTEDAASAVTFNSGTRVYVRDDLEVYGDNSNITMAGNYYGFGRVDYTSESVVGNPEYSSSVILNGVNDSLTLSGTAYLNGNAYINQSGAAKNNYMTGESIALKANQQVYLVPGSWLTVSNPAKTADIDPAKAAKEYLASADKINPALSGLLDATNPIIKKNISTKYYFYFNFKDLDSAKTFIASPATYGVSTDSANTALTTLNSKVRVTGSVYATGAIAKTKTVGTAEQVEIVAPSTYDSSAMLTNHRNYSNRFALMTSLLADFPDKKTAEDGTESDFIINDKTIVDGKRYQLSEFGSSAIANYVDLAKLGDSQYQFTDKEFDVDISGTTTKVVATYSDSDLTLSSNDNVRVVVCSGNVTVSGNFKGMIIAGGTITVTGGNTFEAVPDVVDAFLESNPKVGSVSIRKIFKAYQNEEDSSDGEDIDQLQYSDVIELANWRKY